MRSAAIRILVFTTLGLLVGNAVFAKPTPPIEIDIALPNFVDSWSVGGKVTVQLLTDIAAVRVIVRGTGAIESAVAARDYSGPWRRGESFAFDLPVRATAAGEGSITITVEALDPQQSVLFTRTRELFALAEEGALWLSASSPTDLQFRRIDMLARRRGLSNDEFRTMTENILIRRVPADQTPRAVVPLGPIENRIERAYPATLAPEKALAGAARITVKGHVEWTDRTGRRHGLPKATVEIHDVDTASTTLLATVETDAVGDYTATVSHDDGPGEGNPDIMVRVLARSPAADIKPDESVAATYTLQSPTTSEVPTGTTLTVNLTAGNSADNETVFSLHHALVVIGAYVSTLAGSPLPRIEVRFPTKQSTSLYNGTQLHLLRADRWDWDVVHHEYGHYVMDRHGFQANPGGQHSFTENLAETRGKDIGTRLAWGEGWPTFFGIAGQQVMGVASLNVPNAGDTHYQDTEDATTDLNIETATGKGEDNEVSVISALWDLFDSVSDGDDLVNIPDKDLFTAFKTAAATRFGAAWEAVAKLADTRRRSELGAVFGQSRVAPQLTVPADQLALSPSSAPPTFRWKKNGGATVTALNDFKVVFYRSDFASIIFEKAVGNTDQFTPTTTELATILGGGTPVRWLVQGKNTTAPATPGGAIGFYFSGARTIRVVSSTPSTTSSGTSSPLSAAPPAEFTVEIAVTPGKPDAPTERIAVQRTSASCSLRVERSANSAVLGEAHGTLTPSQCDDVWRIAQRVPDQAPQPTGGAIADFGSRSITIQWKPGNVAPQQQSFHWDRNLKNEAAVRPLFERLVQLARERLPAMNLYYLDSYK